jgi:chromosome segregation ATPase
MGAMRQSWSDDRLDDLNHRVDAGFARVDAQFDRMEKRMQSGFDRADARLEATAAELRQEMQMGFHQVNARFDAMQQTMIRIGAGLIGVLVASSAGLIATQL